MGTYLRRETHGKTFEKAKIKDAGEEKHFPLSFSPLIPLFFLFNTEEEKKTQAREQWRQKQVSVSGGTGVERWIRPRLREGEVGSGN